MTYLWKVRFKWIEERINVRTSVGVFAVVFRTYFRFSQLKLNLKIEHPNLDFTTIDTKDVFGSKFYVGGFKYLFKYQIWIGEFGPLDIFLQSLAKNFGEERLGLGVERSEQDYTRAVNS